MKYDVVLFANLVKNLGILNSINYFRLHQISQLMNKIKPEFALSNIFILNGLSNYFHENTYPLELMNQICKNIPEEIPKLSNSRLMILLKSFGLSRYSNTELYQILVDEVLSRNSSISP